MVISSIRVRKNDSDTDEDLKKGRTAECRPPLFIGFTIICVLLIEITDYATWEHQLASQQAHC